MDSATVFVLCLAGGLFGAVVYLATISRRNAARDGRDPPGEEQDMAPRDYAEHIAIYGSSRNVIR